MDDILGKAIKLAGFYSEKMMHVTLTEYEVMLHEANCRFLEQYFYLQRLRVQQAIREEAGDDADTDRSSGAVTP